MLSLISALTTPAPLPGPQSLARTPAVVTAPRGGPTGLRDVFALAAGAARAPQRGSAGREASQLHLATKCEPRDLRSSSPIRIRHRVVLLHGAVAGPQRALPPHAGDPVLGQKDRRFGLAGCGRTGEHGRPCRRGVHLRLRGCQARGHRLHALGRRRGCRNRRNRHRRRSTHRPRFD